MTPEFQIISIYNKGVEIIPDNTRLTKATVLGVLKGTESSLVFDSKGEKWKNSITSDKVSESFLTRLLANTVYNPIVDVKYIWSKEGKYDLQELKIELKSCIDEDEDVLTQFVESDELKKAVMISTSFEELCQALSGDGID